MLRFIASCSLLLYHLLPHCCLVGVTALALPYCTGSLGGYGRKHHVCYFPTSQSLLEKQAVLFGKNVFPVQERCKACPKTVMSCNGFKLAFNPKQRVDQVVCKGALDQDSSFYNLSCGASLFSLHQIFYLLGMLEIAFVVESVLIRLCSSVFTKI